MRKSGLWARGVVAVFAAAATVGLVGVSQAPAAPSTGQLTFADCVGGGAGCVATPGSQASALSFAFTHNGKTLYAGFGTGIDGGISRFSVGTTGTLNYTDCINGDGLGGQCAVTLANDPGALKFPWDLALSPNGQSLYVADDGDPHSTGGFVDQLSPDQSGKLQWDGCYSGDGTGGRCLATNTPLNPLGNPDEIAISADGSSVYVAGSMLNNAKNDFEGVANHFLANNNGQLTFDGCVNDDDGNNSCGPVPGAPFGLSDGGIATSPSGGIYVAGESSVMHFTPTSGAGMPFSDCISNNGSGGKCAEVPGGASVFGLGRALAVTSDGKQLYALSSAGIDHLTLGADGRMTWADCISDDGTGGTCSGIPASGDVMFDATDMAITPDGTSLYAVSGKRTAITAFNIGANGTLTFAQCLTATTVSGCTTDPHLISIGKISVSPDSKSVYVTANTSILHFSRATAASSGTGGTTSTTTGGTGSTGTGGTSSGTTDTAGGGNSTHTVSSTVGNLALSFSFQSTSCSTTVSTLRPKLSVVTIAKSKATKWTFTKASMFLDSGIRHVSHPTVLQHGKKVKITKVTFTPNQTVTKPASVPVKLKGLKSGAHTLTFQVLLHRPAPKGTKVMPTTTKTLRASFKVC